MEKIIREVNTRLQQLLPAGKNHLNIADFRAAGLPEPLIDRIQLEIFQHLDRSLPLPRTDWVDMSESSVQQAWTVFMQNLRNHSHLPTSQKTVIFTNSVDLVIRQLVEPRQAIATQLFEDDTTLTYEQLQHRSQKIVVYRHLIVGLIRYMDRRNLRVLPIEKCKDVLSQIDHKFSEDYSPMNWVQLLSPWFDFFGKRIPVDLLRRFFIDKRNSQLTAAFPESLIDLNKTEIIERLSAPDLPVSYHKMDDPERERKMAQQIQPLENAGTYYEEFLKLREANRQKWANLIDERVPNSKVLLAEIETAEHQENEVLPAETDLNTSFEEQQLNSDIEQITLGEEALNETFTEKEDDKPIEKADEKTLHAEESPEKSEPEAADHHKNEIESAQEDVQLLDAEQHEVTLNENFEEKEDDTNDSADSEPIVEADKPASPEPTVKKAEDFSFHDLAEEGVLDEIEDIDDIDAMMASIEKGDDIEDSSNESIAASEGDAEDDLTKLLAEQEEKLRRKQLAVEQIEDVKEVVESPVSESEVKAEEPEEDDDTDLDMDALFAGNDTKEEEVEESPEPKSGVKAEEPEEEDTADFDMDALFAGNDTKEEEVEESPVPDSGVKSEEPEEDDADFDMDALFAANLEDESPTDTDEEKEEPTKASDDDINAMFGSTKTEENDSSNDIESLFSDDDASVDEVLNGAARSLGENEGLLEYLSDYHDYFIKELFDGSAEAFSQCVEDVDSFSQWPEASEYLNNDIFSAYGIDMISEPAIKLIDELQTYFAHYKNN